MSTSTVQATVFPAASLQGQILQALPKDTFAPQPLRALWTVPIVGAIVLGTLAIVELHLPWYGALAIAVMIGSCYGTMLLLAHEVLHGAIVRTPWLQTLIGYLGFAPFLISPSLWRYWHNGIHHGYTNVGDSDPDAFGTMRRYKTQPTMRLFARLAPGSGRWYSALFLFYWFTFQGLVVLWVQTRYMRAFRRFDARRAKIETVLFVCGWLALAVWAGWPTSLFAVFIPMAVANFSIMSYIATNHFLRPQAENREPIDNSMGVTTWPFLDRIHFTFSHHVEHHYFPAMSGGKLPRVRAWLQQHAAERYVAPPHWKAVLYLYKTPRVYLDANTLCDPGDTSHTVDIDALTPALQSRSAV